MPPLQRLPSLNALRAFEAVARRLSFARAAEELHVTKAAVAQQIRLLEQTRGDHVSIFAMTAHAMKSDRDECLSAGMDGYLSKPVQLKQLEGAISAQLSAMGRSREG